LPRYHGGLELKVQDCAAETQISGSSSGVGSIIKTFLAPVSAIQNYLGSVSGTTALVTFSPQIKKYPFS